MAPLGFTQCIYPANSIIMPCETGLRRDSNQRKQTAGVSLSLFCCSCSGTLSLLRFTLIITRCVPEMANLSHKVLHKTTGLKLISLWPLQNLPSFFCFYLEHLIVSDRTNEMLLLSYFFHCWTQASISAKPSHCRLSAALSPCCRPGPPPPDSVTVCSMMSCCSGGVVGGVFGVLVVECAAAR